MKRSGENMTNLMIHLERQHRCKHQQMKEEDKRRKMQTRALDEVSLQVTIWIFCNLNAFYLSKTINQLWKYQDI